MKKLITLAAVALVALNSCNLDINDDPNYPSGPQVTPEKMLPSAENAIADVLGDQMFTYAGFFSQYFEQRPEQNQYNNLAELNIDESSNLFDRCYRMLYAGALKDLQVIMEKSPNKANHYVCTVLRVWAYQLIVDNFSDAPYSEALMGQANPTPKWEDGKTVLMGVLDELDKAEANLGDASVNLDDPLMGKKLSQWKGFANALRLRIYMRFIDGGIDVASYTQKVKDLVAANAFFKGDVKFDVYTNAEKQYNPWYGAIFALRANNFAAAYPIVEYYKANNDPRISYAIAKMSTGNYVGQLPGSKVSMKEWRNSLGWKNGNVSRIEFKVMAAKPVYAFSASELNFLLAEVQLRFNNDAAKAKETYEAGVTADFAFRGMEGKAAAFLKTDAIKFDGKTTDEQLHLVYMQKWAAFFMCNHMEAWSEIRRTDVPKTSAKTAKQIFDGDAYTPGELIVPAVNHIQVGGLAKRLPYPQDARKYNKVNTPPEKKLSDPVFWDVK